MSCLKCGTAQQRKCFNIAEDHSQKNIVLKKSKLMTKLGRCTLYVVRTYLCSCTTVNILFKLLLDKIEANSVKLTLLNSHYKLVIEAFRSNVYLIMNIMIMICLRLELKYNYNINSLLELYLAKLYYIIPVISKSTRALGEFGSPNL